MTESYWNTEILLIDKPKGITSFDVIRRLRRMYTDTHDGAKAPKMGHAGTLDPLASGLMILGIRQGTKLLTSLIKLDKEYIAEVLVGEQRTTGDMEGEVVVEKEVLETAEILQSKISAALADMVGILTLPVSAYSAIKKDGIPMYKRARSAEQKGEQVTEVLMREMCVYEAELTDFVIVGKRAVATVRFKVGSGTYVRSLGEELGQRVGYPATLQNLRRTQVGKYMIAEAIEV